MKKFPTTDVPVILFTGNSGYYGSEPDYTHWYKSADVVVHHGVKYQALQYSSGVEPGAGTNWQNYWKWST